MMRNMGIAMEEFYNVAGNKKIHPYFNLYPYLVWNSLSGYESYLNAFMETKPKYIAYDMYPFVGETAEMDDSYFTNLSIIRKYAKKYKIPFWAYLQSCGKNQDSGADPDGTGTDVRIAHDFGLRRERRKMVPSLPPALLGFDCGKRICRTVLLRWF